MDKQALINFYNTNTKAIKILLYLIIFLIIFIALVISIVLIFGPKRNNNQNHNFSYLPGDLAKDPNAGLNADALNGIKAEDIMFGHFYNKHRDNFRSQVNDFHLPLNIKTDTENYYDISRKINLDDYIDDLNTDGFKIINNPYQNANNFLSVYNKLLQDEVPIVLTSDFLMYYYQNNLKNVFDEIERNTFYKNIWNIYKNLFDVASARYEERLSRLGISNDNILEGERLETAYLAVVLKLLTPTEKQINQKQTLNNFSKFSQKEALYYDFILPDYLEKDVSQELENIKFLRTINRSPVMSYVRDYSVFQVPREYKEDAKLYNFYLATKWLNSVFPLYFRNNDCPDCLLDKNDWLIHLVAASYLTKDLSSNQIDKNKWAIIYKFLSFFSGLRQDLTYLEYNRVLEDIYGQGYVLENIFSRKNFSDIDIYKIQEKLADNKFSPIEGSYDRTQGKNILIGMRMLQESYWPNDYIFSHLSGKQMKTRALKSAQKKQTTLCRDYRCTASAIDVFNLANPLDANETFIKESNYTNYNLAVQSLRDYMAGFNVFTWNTNIYWSTLDTLNILLAEDKSKYSVYMNSDKWFNNKELNSALGAWTNIHVAKDIISLSQSRQSDFLNLRPTCDLPNYVEPGIDYLYENIARNNMLLKMMDVLNISRDTNLAALDIDDVSNALERIIEINKKILTNNLLNYNDCMYIRGLVNNKKAISQGKKYFVIKQDEHLVRESIDDVKLLILVFKSGKDKIIAMGPVFNYKETKN